MEGSSDMSFEVSIPTQLHLYADARRLKIILNNLIVNAIKYSDRNKSAQWVKISAEVIDDKCEISIADNGLGIRKEFHDKIFNMFYRASERSTGSGLGLYIVKETAAKMGGQIEFTSTEGVGSVFNFSLPAKCSRLATPSVG
jgi:signal transduction histidine kinase